MNYIKAKIQIINIKKVKMNFTFQYSKICFHSKRQKKQKKINNYKKTK